MKNSIFLILIVFLVSCKIDSNKTSTFKNEFSAEETKIMDLSRTLINQTYYCTLVTIDQTGQPKARVMEPFAPEHDFTIWLATNPKSRKVIEIKNNPKTTIHYFDKMNMGYVSLMGSAYLINNDSIKSKHWKPGWERFYKNKKKDYLLIKFIPQTLELISIPNGYTGDSINWMPHKIDLRK